MKAYREDAIEHAAAHPKARHRWSDRQETFSWVLVILKYQILSFKTERHTTNIAGSGGVQTSTAQLGIRIGILPPMVNPSGVQPSATGDLTWQRVDPPSPSD